jgi:hypothetical protein
MEGSIEKKFKEFVADNSFIVDYEDYEIFGSKVLLRLFLYTPDKKSGILGLDGKPIEDEIDFGRKARLIPLAKIIKLGTGVNGEYAYLKPGDIVHVADDISSSHVNPAWIEWMEHRDERPKVKTPEPAMMIGNINAWKPHVFIANKISGELKTIDAYTFAVPQSFILGRYHG